MLLACKEAKAKLPQQVFGTSGSTASDSDSNTQHEHWPSEQMISPADFAFTPVWLQVSAALLR